MSFTTSYVPDWLDKLESKEERWNRRIEELLALQKELKRKSKDKAEKRVLPQKLKGLAPAFTEIGVTPRDVRVLSHPVDFIGFDGMSAGKLRRIVLMDSKENGTLRPRTQKSIESTVDNGNYDWQILRVDNEGSVSQE